MPSELTTERPGFAIRIAPSWEQIEPLGRYLGFWLQTRVPNDGIERAGLVVQELLENAVRYGDPTQDVELAVIVSRGGNFVDVRVTNHAHPSRIAILERELARLKQFDPQEAFARAMERLQKLPKGTSMLGLSRVALEANLDCDIQLGTVTLRARVAANHGGRALPKPGSGKVRISGTSLPASSSGTHQMVMSAAPPSGTRQTGSSLSAELPLRSAFKK